MERNKEKKGRARERERGFQGGCLCKLPPPPPSPLTGGGCCRCCKATQDHCSALKCQSRARGLEETPSPSALIRSIPLSFFPHFFQFFFNFSHYFPILSLFSLFLLYLLSLSSSVSLSVSLFRFLFLPNCICLSPCGYHWNERGNTRREENGRRDVVVSLFRLFR